MPVGVEEPLFESAEEPLFGPEEPLFGEPAPAGIVDRALQFGQRQFERFAPLDPRTGRREGIIAGMGRQLGGVDRPLDPRLQPAVEEFGRAAEQFQDINIPLPIAGGTTIGTIARAARLSVGELAEMATNAAKITAPESTAAERLGGVVGSVPFVGTDIESARQTLARGDIMGGLAETAIAVPVTKMIKAGIGIPLGLVGRRAIEKAVLEQAQREAITEGEQRAGQAAVEAEVRAPAQELAVEGPPTEGAILANRPFQEPFDPVAREWEEYLAALRSRDTPEVPITAATEVGPRTFIPVQERAARQGGIPEASELPTIPPGQQRLPGPILPGLSRRGEELPLESAAPSPVAPPLPSPGIRTLDEGLPPGELSGPAREIPRERLETQAFAPPDLAQVPVMDQTLSTALRDAQKVTSQTRRMRASAVAERFATAEKTLEAGGGLDEARRMLAGQLPTGKASPLGLSAEQIAAYTGAIEQSGLPVAAKLRAQDGLTKLASGQVLKQSEILELRQVFPQAADAASEVAEHAPKIKWGIALLDIQRSLFAGGDFSALLRQMAIPVTANPRMGLEAARRGFSIAGSPFRPTREATLQSQERYIQFLDELDSNPNRELWDQAGLALVGPAVQRNWGEIVEREGFGVNPIIAAAGPLGTVYQNINRGNAASITAMRTKYFDSIARPYLEAGQNFKNSPEVFKGIAQWVNVSTGRGSLGKLDNIQNILGLILFSPKYLGARIQLLGGTVGAPFGQGFIAKLPTAVRAKALKDIGSWAAQRFAVLGSLRVAKSLGATELDVNFDPRSADFGKIRQGQATLDLFSGQAQTVRAISRIVMWGLSQANRETQSGDRVKESPLDVAGAFFQSAFNPSVGVAARILSESGGPSLPSTTFGGEEKSIKRLLGESAPGVLQAIYELDKQQDDAGWMIPFAALGVGTQTYQAPAKLNAQERAMLRKRETSAEESAELRKVVEKITAREEATPAGRLARETRTNLRLTAERDILALLVKGEKKAARIRALEYKRATKGRSKIDVRELEAALKEAGTP